MIMISMMRWKIKFNYQ